MQDQAFLGPESGLAIPDADGGVDLFISTQWLHEDRRQVADCLGLPGGTVRLHSPASVAPSGAREDVSLQVHVCLLALRTGRPVKMVYGRDESFVGHVHRHPGHIWMRHTRHADGTLVNLESRVVLDGGAYASTSSAVLINAVTHVRVRTVCPTRASTAGPCAPTTRRAARCAASACCRRASRTRARWTSLPPSSAWNRSSCGCGTRSRRVTCSSPGRPSSVAPTARCLPRPRHCHCRRRDRRRVAGPAGRRRAHC